MPDTSETKPWWTWRRKTAVKGIALAVLTFPIALWAAYQAWPVSYAHLGETGVLRLGFLSLAPVALFCFFMFTRTARLFDSAAAEDVLAGEPGTETPKWQRNARIYQNTVEQGLIFVCALLALSAVVTPETAQILPVLSALWLFGRVSFYLGYHVDPAYRAFGFDYTLFPSLFALGWVGAALLGWA